MCQNRNHQNSHDKKLDKVNVKSNSLLNTKIIFRYLSYYKSQHLSHFAFVQYRHTLVRKKFRTLERWYLDNLLKNCAMFFPILSFRTMKYMFWYLWLKISGFYRKWIQNYRVENINTETLHTHKIQAMFIVKDDFRSYQWSNQFISLTYLAFVTRKIELIT